MRKWPVGTLARWWVWLLAGATVPQCGLGRRLGCLAAPGGLQLGGTEGVEEPFEFLQLEDQVEEGVTRTSDGWEAPLRSQSFFRRPT